MKTKIVLLLICCSIGMNVWSQSIKIEPSNPLPRVGQEFEIELSLNFLNDIVVSSLDNLLMVSDSKFSDIKIKLISKDTGNIILGPYTFKFEDSLINTDSISLFIRPDLEKKPGLWISKFIQGDNTYIILEEIAYTNWINTKIGKIDSHKLDMPKDDQAFLVDDKKNNIGFKKAFSNYTPYYQSELKDYSEKVLYYSRDVYYVLNPDNKEIIITQKHIKNGPKNIYIE